MVLGTWGTENHLRKVKEEQEKSEKIIEELGRKRIELEQKNAELERTKAELEGKTDAMNLLTQKLLAEDKLDELKRSSTDQDYQMELLKKYHLL